MVFSQKTIQSKIDSLETVIKETKNDSLRSDACSELAFAYIGLDSTKAQMAADKAIAIAKENNDVYNLGKAYIHKGGVNLDYSVIDEAYKNYLKANEFLKSFVAKDSSKKNLKLWLRSLHSMAVVASYQGDLKSELYFKDKSIKLANRLNEEHVLARIYFNSAVTLFNQGVNQEAYAFLNKSGPLFKKIGEYDVYIQDRLLFSSVLGVLDSLDRMKAVIEESKVYIDKLQDSSKLHLYYMSLSDYYNLKDNYKLSIENLLKTEEILDDSGLGNNKTQMYVSFIRVHDKFNNHKKAKRYAEEYLDYTKQSNDKLREADVYKQLSVFEKKDRNIRKSLDYLEKYVKIKDSINFYELTEQINTLESKYEKEKKEREILELKNKNDRAELELSRKKEQNYSLLLISASLLFLSFLGYYGYRNFRRKAKSKEEELIKLKHEQEAIVYNAMLEGQEKERERLAADLHDGLAGRLSATRIKLERLSKTIENNEQLNNAVDNIDNSLSELRNIARNLMPETVLKYGLKAAVEDYCTSVSTGLEDDIKFIIQFYDTDANIPKNTLLTLYRIIQELINNAIKHSKATEVLIQYLIEDNKINITVEDNGQGFSYNENDKKNGMGLHNLKTRVAYLNGEIDLISSIDEGTTAHIVIKI